MIKQTIRLLFLLPLLPAMWVLSEEAALFLTANLPRSLSNWGVYGFVAYILFYPLLYGNTLLFFELLLHELTHAIFDFLCLRGVRKLEVNPPNGFGVVIPEKASGQYALVSLAPYFVPLLALPLLLVKWLVFPDSHGALDLLIGLALGFHFAALVRFLCVRQPDIWDTGLLFAMPVIIFLNLVLIVVALGVLLSEYAALESYFAVSFARIPSAYEDVLWIFDQGLQWASSFE